MEDTTYSSFTFTAGERNGTGVLYSKDGDLLCDSRHNWHGAVEISCADCGENGLPTPEESQVMYDLEDRIVARIVDGATVCPVGRVFVNNISEFYFRTSNPKNTAPILQQLLDEGLGGRDASFRIWQDDEEVELDWFRALVEQL